MPANWWTPDRLFPWQSFQISNRHSEAWSGAVDLQRHRNMLFVSRVSVLANAPISSLNG